MRYSAFNIVRVLFGRLETGEDLLKSLVNIVKRESIKSGSINLIGALSRVRLGFFDPSTGTYDVYEDDGLYELVSCVGNISWDGDEPIVHIHLAASKEDRSVGGHVLDGNIVGPTVEFTIFEFDRRVSKRYFEDAKLKLLDL